jgi:hypothetical protein
VGARALYLEMAKRYNGSNNGRISYSVREGAAALHVSKGSVKNWLDVLQERGFIVCTRRGAFSLKVTRDASEWRLTEYNCDTPAQHATKDFMRWTCPYVTHRSPADHFPAQPLPPTASTQSDSHPSRN